MENSIILQNVSPEELKNLIKQAIRAELDNHPKKENIKYLSREETAKLLKISLPTLHFYTKKGIIKSHRIGSRVLFLESDIQTAVKEIKNLKYQR